MEVTTIFYMKKTLMIMIALCAILSSCSISQDATFNQNLIQTSVVLDQKNYKVIGNVSGTSEQNYIFGIGGLSPKSLRESAMSNMLQNADLKNEARAIINTNIHYKNQFYVVWTKRTAIATGTVIEFTE